MPENTKLKNFLFEHNPANFYGHVSRNIFKGENKNFSNVCAGTTPKKPLQDCIES